jgi:hypothetical protein
MLSSYKMTHDAGFAPNPFHGILSLATCKPEIRLTKQVGEYVAGFTSKALCGENVGEERLIYIMRITEKLSYDTYWHDPGFQIKKLSNESDISRVGDNIYKPIKKLAEFNIDNYTQVKNPYHDTKALKERDLKGRNVLLSEDFFYFGAGAIPIDKFKIKVPKTQSSYGYRTIDETEINRLWSYLSDRYPKNIDINKPHCWPPANFDGDCNGSICIPKNSLRDKC